MGKHTQTHTVAKDSNFFEAVKLSPVSLAEGIICFFSVWSILGLAGFHSYLVCLNLTTNEEVKGSFSRKRQNAIPNPYAEDTLCKNCFVTLCSPLPPR